MMGLFGRTALALWVSATIISPSSQAMSNSWAIEDIEAEVNRVAFLSPRLAFSDWLQEQQSLARVSLTDISRWQRMRENIAPGKGCARVRHDNLQLQLNLLRNRTRLLSTLPNDTEYTGVMSNLPDGKEWYSHWLNSWLMMASDGPLSEAHILTLQHIAQQELEKVHPQYLSLQAQAIQQQMPPFTRHQHDAIRQALLERAQVVNKHLENVFGALPAIPDVSIRASSLPESFPAPGIYNDATQTFYYHFTGHTLPAESLDWLYLHEAVPGHHMQYVVANSEPLCESAGIARFPPVTAEGWAAYVETLGQQLGLLQHPASLLYAYEWRQLRALRVLIDIGVHREQWSDRRALTLWQQYLPERMDIGARELARIKRWPAQVITYVYGKYQIEQAIKQALDSGYSAVEAHHMILRLSNQPSISAQTVSYFLTRRKSF